jgi:hypothetical protein
LLTDGGYKTREFCRVNPDYPANLNALNLPSTACARLVSPYQDKLNKSGFEIRTISPKRSLFGCWSMVAGLHA